MIELTRDTTFKKLMKEKKGKQWFDSIIKDLIGIDLSKYDYYSESYTSGETTKHDFYTDIALKHGKDIVIIEMQNNKLGSDKSYYYLFRVAGYNMEQGMNVGNKTVLIRMLNYFPNEKIKKEVGKIIHMQYMNAEYEYVAEMIEGYDIVLPNFIKKTYNKAIEKRMRMFSCKSYEEMKKYATTKLDFWIIKRLQELERDEDFMIYYDEEIVKEMDKNIIKDEMKKECAKARAEGHAEGHEQGIQEGRAEGHEQGIAEGHEQGIQEGLEQGKREMIHKLKELDMPLDQIAHVVNMKVEEVKNIIKEIKDED